MYAQQLTWGFMDVLAQYYNFDKMNNMELILKLTKVITIIVRSKGF